MVIVDKDVIVPTLWNQMNVDVLIAWLNLEEKSLEIQWFI